MIEQTAQLRVRNDRQDQRIDIRPGVPTELGRAVKPRAGVAALRIKDNYCSRYQIRVTPDDDGRVLVENLSDQVPIDNNGGLPETIKAGASVVLDYPVRLQVGASELTIAPRGDTPELPGCQPVDRPLPSERSIVASGELGSDELPRWFASLISVQQSAAGSDEFYQQTADALVDLVGLDQGLVLLYEDGEWRVTAIAGGTAERPEYSQTLLDHILSVRTTYFGTPGDHFSDAASLTHVATAVASPILAGGDGGGDVTGAVYGARLSGQTGGSALRGPEISKLQAQLVSLLAAAVGTGLARARRETETARLRSQFADFCSRQIVEELERNQGLLASGEREVSVLFCDMRDFTCLSTACPLNETHNLMSEVMDTLAECVLRSDGVIIDFYGDGLAAMWNAPVDQEDHPNQAVECARDIVSSVADLTTRSAVEQEMTIRVGVGVHTGQATVGNIGGRRRIKYGPRGPIVNLASRIEQLTKRLGVDALVTAATFRRMDSENLSARRIGAWQPAGTNSPVELYQLFAADDVLPERPAMLFQSALDQFEAGELNEAENQLQLAREALGERRDTVADFLWEEITRRRNRPDVAWPSYIVLDEK